MNENLQQWFADGEVSDIHVNVGHACNDLIIDGDVQGEHVRRQYRAEDLAHTSLKYIGLRTHYSHVEVPTVHAERFIPSVALNWCGIDAERVAQELKRFSCPSLVWCQSFRDPYHRSVIDSAYRGSIAAGGEEQGIVTHTDSFGRLTEAMGNVLEVAREHGAIVATPHANWERTVPLILHTVDMGINVLWVHPDSRLIRTPLAVQQAIAAYGNGQQGKGKVYIERAAVFLRDGKPGAYSAQQVVHDVRAIGKAHIVFSSDLGRYKATDALFPDEGLLWYMDLLMNVGLTDEEARMGCVVNPSLLRDR